MEVTEKSLLYLQKYDTMLAYTTDFLKGHDLQLHTWDTHASNI